MELPPAPELPPVSSPSDPLGEATQPIEDEFVLVAPDADPGAGTASGPLQATAQPVPDTSLAVAVSGTAGEPSRDTRELIPPSHPSEPPAAGTIGSAIKLIAALQGIVPGLDPIVGSAAELVVSTLAGLRRHDTPGPSPGSGDPPSPSVPTPRDAPDGALSAAGGSSTSLLLVGFAALMLSAPWAVPRLARRLEPALALWRPMPFISPHERPG